MIITTKIEFQADLYETQFIDPDTHEVIEGQAFLALTPEERERFQPRNLVAACYWGDEQVVKSYRIDLEDGSEPIICDDDA